MRMAHSRKRQVALVAESRRLRREWADEVSIWNHQISSIRHLVAQALRVRGLGALLRRLGRLGWRKG
ncbi:MAG: hypothetical protein WCP04_13675 [Pseudomonadota bacterium]